MRLNDVSTVVILAGGPSSEAAVSRVTAKGIGEALDKLAVSHQTWELDTAGEWVSRLAAMPRVGTFVFIALHGCPGEDGTVQGVLDLLGVPYNGSGVLGNALAMDKVRARVLMQNAGLAVADALYGELLTDEALTSFLSKHGQVVVKPVASGSSVGVSIISDMKSWPAARAKAAVEGDVLVEAYIPGRELTIGVLAGVDGIYALPVVEIIAKKDAFYDYDSKYAAGGSDHICPAQLPDVVTTQAQQGAVQAVKSVSAIGACRVDFRYDAKSSSLVVLEVNTLPGMTPTSLLPDAARYAHPPMDYPALVRWMIEDGLKRFELKR